MNKIKQCQDRIWKILIIISIIFLISLLLFVYCSKSRVYKVGILSGLNFFVEIIDGFKSRMTELGYIEGKNIIYDIHKMDFDITAYDKVLKKFIENKVDLILLFPTEVAQQAKVMTKGTDIPIIFVNAFTEDTGLVNSVQEPGGNITGVRWPGPELAVKKLEVLLELVPQVKQVIVSYQRDITIVKSQLEVLHKAALSVNITLIEIPASSTTELKIELQKQKGPFDKTAICTIAEPLIATSEGFAVVSMFAARHSIPICGGPVLEDNYSSIFDLVPESISQGKQAAYLADKIFKGTPAGKIPVVTAEYIFILNYKQAKKLKLNITERLLTQIDQIIR